MWLLSTEVTNFQGVIHVEMQPARRGTTIIAGKNENGKTSLLAAIAAALQGKAELPQEPVRYGETKSKTVLELGGEEVELRVTHEIVEKDGEWKRSLEVFDVKTGKPVAKPQKVLDELYSRIAFDPSQFAKAKPEEQDKILKDLAGIADAFAELDRDHEVIYRSRTDKNREVEQAKARAAGMPKHPGVPGAEVSVVELAKQLEAAREHNHARTQTEQAVARQESNLDEARNAVAQLEAQLAAAREKSARETASLADQREAFFALAPAIDPDPLQAKLATSEETNAKVRANLAKKAEERRAEALEAEADKLTASLKAIDTKKQKLLEGARFPVPGLGFGPLGPTLDGAPLAQCSTARRLQLSYRVGVTQNPKLKLLIMREGAFFDEDSLADLDAMALADDYQLMVERVGKRHEGGTVIILEKGLVESATAAE